VYINNKKIAPKAPFKGYKLSPGKHLMWVANPASGLDVTKTITIIPGHEVVIHVGSPEDDYLRVEVPYGIQFQLQEESPPEVADEVLLPWEKPPSETDDGPRSGDAQGIDPTDLIEYPASK